MIALPILAGLIPGFRLARQTAAARREGLWTEGADVRRAIGPTRPEDNAWPWLRREPQVFPHEFGHASLTSVRKDALRKVYETPPLFGDLYVGVTKPRLDFGRDWNEPGLYGPDIVVLRDLGRRLLLAAALGVAPRRNVHAAARLAALAFQEPTFAAARIGTELARNALAADPAVEPLLGPPPDFHDRLREMMLEDLKAVRAMATSEGRRALGFKESQMSLVDRIAHCRPIAAATEAALIDDWRTLWRELPRDPSDLEAAARVFDRRFPAIDRRFNGFFAMPFGGYHRDAKLLRPLIELRDARRKARNMKL